MHRLHKTRFYSLVEHYWKNGLSLCIRGNKRRLPSSAFSAETIERVVKFIMNIAEDQALLLPCCLEGTVHYSYDYAQQLHYPADPYQPGPIYFKTPRKCGLFGVCCEAIPRQVNFLIDENVQMGKGANRTINYNMLITFLSTTDTVKRSLSYMPITVGYKIRTTPSYGTTCRG